MMRVIKSQCAFHCRLRPTTNGVRLEILINHQPLLAQIGPNIGNIIGLNGQGRCAGKAGVGHEAGTDAGHRSPARSIFEHCRMIDAAHHLRARAVIFGNAQGVPRLVNR